jgi:hypothetical protein
MMEPAIVFFVVLGSSCSNVNDIFNILQRPSHPITKIIHAPYRVLVDSLLFECSHDEVHQALLDFCNIVISWFHCFRIGVQLKVGINRKQNRSLLNSALSARPDVSVIPSIIQADSSLISRLWSSMTVVLDSETSSRVVRRTYCTAPRENQHCY